MRRPLLAVSTPPNFRALAALVALCTLSPAGPAPGQGEGSQASPAPFRGQAVALPGATAGLDLDYIACDRASGRVWVPAAGTGSVDVIAPRTLAVTRVEGFPTARLTLKGHDFVLGPTAIALGDGVAYVGNRGDGKICPVDTRKMQVGNCLALGSAEDLATSADGLAYVRGAKELWVTLGAPPLGINPPDRSILVFDASRGGNLVRKTKVVLEGAAEGYAVDERRGRFYTNLADADRTLAIDVRTHRVVATWQPHCGEEGPRGIAADEERGFVFVACTDHVVVLDGARDGKELASLPTGAGVDNIDYVESRRELFVAAGKVAVLTVLGVDDRGRLEIRASEPTVPGARVVVADNDGTAYVTDPRGGRILALPRSR
jgi:DNA-binding beta-propeller fold protein YncE